MICNDFAGTGDELLNISVVLQRSITADGDTTFLLLMMVVNVLIQFRMVIRLMQMK